MSDFLGFLWRHPRRTGLIILNVVVLVAFVGWGWFTAEMSDEGVGGIPNVMVGYTGMALLIAVWVVAWLVWIGMLARHYLLRPR